MQYMTLKSGNRIEKNDEYSTENNVWREVPKFMIGDKIPDSSTQWRRPIAKKVASNNDNTKKKKWTDIFKFFV